MLKLSPPPRRQDTINVRVWRHTIGMEIVEGITGINVYPLSIHRPLDEFEEIQSGSRSRYSGIWHITHIPTGKSFGIQTRVWEDIVYYVDNIKDEPALLMITDKTMTSHPCFKQLSDRHYELRREIGH